MRRLELTVAKLSNAVRGTDNEAAIVFGKTLETALFPRHRKELWTTRLPPPETVDDAKSKSPATDPAVRLPTVHSQAPPE
jgi:hypothetical protein